jgi:hypothetical protein
MRRMIETVRAVLAYPKRVLAMNVSNGVRDKRLTAAGGPQAVEARRACRGLASARLNAMNAAPSPKGATPSTLTFPYAPARA